MTQDVNSLFQEYLKGIGKNEWQIFEGKTPSEENIKLVRKDFYDFCLKKGFALKDYSIFESDDFEYLRKVVLSVPKSVDYDEYWHRASAAMAEMIVQELGIDATSHVLDFGCGVGRVARCVMEQMPCRMTGVDISASMLKTAERYIGSPQFRPLASADFHANPQGAGQFTAAYALIVLQHCSNPEAELRAIRSACASGSRFFAANARRRFVPTTAGWQDDGIDVRALIESFFIVEKEIDTSAIPALRFDPNGPPTADESDHYVLVARVP